MIMAVFINIFRLIVFFNILKTAIDIGLESAEYCGDGKMRLTKAYAHFIIFFQVIIPESCMR